MGFYQVCVEKGRCSNCDGRAWVWAGGGPNGEEYFKRECPACLGSGKPTALDLERAEIEARGLCIRCLLPDEDHQAPYGCELALVKEVRRLRVKIEALEAVVTKG